MQNPFKENAIGEYCGYSFDVNSAIKKLPSSATAFALTSDGYLVTNYHVVENAEIIKIRGKENNAQKTYNAIVVIIDLNNDLAIIKIEDDNYKKLANIPFKIDPKVADLGSEIFVLGYPLVGSMGEDIKLTNGIISAKSGFKGDISLYQMTAPVQPGNSGGPLFDSKGNLIGIVCAKHLGTENVSYAVKASYLLNLIESMDKPIKINTKNTISTKSLTEKVKYLEKLVYIVEIN